MTVGAAAVLILLALGFVLFVRAADVPAPIPVSPIAHLEDRKYAIYDNLRDLQFEYRVGKLSDEDYQTCKISLQKELAGVLAETEATIARLGLQAVRPTSASKTVRKQKLATTICTACGARFDQALKFCGECGKAIV